MRIPYFPGCTLKTKARPFETSLLSAGRAVGLELEELPEWNCCGATFPLLADNALDLAGPTRVLIDARKHGHRLAVACTTCYNVLRRTNHALRSDEALRDKLNYFIEADYAGDLEVVDVLQVLRDEVGFHAVRAAVTLPLAGLRVAAYYGCMVLRPPRVVAYEDPERPRALDDLMTALGAEAVDYSHRGECCGAYLAVKSPDATAGMCSAIVRSAQSAGAQLLVTNCPVCQFNLDRQQAMANRRQAGRGAMPVLYYSQLLALALGLPADFEGHYIDPRPVLRLADLSV